ncbi:PAS domain-containing protein [Methylobacterium trifolii]|uniref:histidine kinase n=1 Tax=Methylobacterium trifolii TaxID=1003092 RepID=A0ABQ4TW08_9HYPH|nr:PAS domain-containing protein [Methylobacterium trifolii]GJE58761.1 hypothetical protein MPOCJGCO_0844 [Methylobacterium trifolii]
MIFAANSAGVFEYLCPEWTNYTGQTPKEYFGNGWLERVHADDRQVVRSIFSEAVIDEAAFSIRFRVQCADGATRWIGAGGVPSFGPPGRTFLGYLGSMTEMATSATDVLVAYGTVGSFTPPPPHLSTMPVSSLDMVADHLLIAHALVAEGDDKRALPAVREALLLVGRGLARQSKPGTRIN